ncbi:hypothetical protein SMICM304S_03410 [Streptomyces microflavus]
MLAFARLYAFVTRPCTGSGPCQPGAHDAAGARESAVLYAGLATAYDLAGREMRRGREPRPGEALDGFVDAYANTYAPVTLPDSAACSRAGSPPIPVSTGTGS